ncbi:MAG: hypothetical protein IH586_18760, partial [Anaerolineaceae bacterium]|nr:hypothetical protein [Anaerolineaceae bacterium]
MPYQDEPLLEEAEPENITPVRRQRLRLIRGEKIGPAFWTISSLISLTVNIILIIAMILVSRQLFSIKKVAQDQLVGGLFSNFIKMDQAHIRTTIPVSAMVPAKFDLPLNTTTTVILTEDT